MNLIKFKMQNAKIKMTTQNSKLIKRVQGFEPAYRRD